MKNFTLLFLALILGTGLYAQAPEKFSYQAIIRDANGAILANSTVDVLLGILRDNPSNGTIVYEEFHGTLNTNENGLVTFEIGDGSPVSGTLSGIDWTDGPYFLEVETTVNGVIISSNSELLSVPYALHAKEAADVVSKKEYILITPGMVEDITLSNGATKAIAPIFRSCIDLPDGNNNNIEFSVSVPIPANYVGGGIAIRVLYACTDTIGTIRMALGLRGNSIGSDLVPFTGGGTQTIFPSALNELQEVIQFVNGFGLDSDARLLQLLVRRTAADANDTNAGAFRIFGIALEYDN